MRIKYNDIRASLKMFEIRVNADMAINNSFEKSAAALEEQAKLNAPWKDRTGNARRTLTGCCENGNFEKKKLSVVGKMSYSPKLELYYGGKYSILFPTVLKNAEEVFRGVVRNLKGVRV